MIDIHSHLLSNIDDGVKSEQEALDLIESAKKQGVIKIIITPHFISDSEYNADNSKKNEAFLSLKNKIPEVDLYLGNENYIDLNLSNYIGDNQAKTLNDTKYVLFELPLNTNYNGWMTFIKKMNKKGYKLILAHPERYQIFMDNPLLANEFIENKVLFQSNIGSFTGLYGKKIQKFAIKLLKHKMISFIGSDVHSLKHNNYLLIPEFNEVIKKYLNEEELKDITDNNALKVINNEEIVNNNYILFKKTIFKHIK